MNCHNYRSQWTRFSCTPLPREIWESQDYEAWADHCSECSLCSDWSLAAQVRARGEDPERFACVHMAVRVTSVCERHTDRHDCPEALVLYNPRFDEYGIPIRDGGSSVAVIRFCPWCGIQLPESRRAEWFARIEALKIDPWSDDVPAEYQTDEWYRGKAT